MITIILKNEIKNKANFKKKKLFNHTMAISLFESVLKKSVLFLFRAIFFTQLWQLIQFNVTRLNFRLFVHANISFVHFNQF